MLDHERFERAKSACLTREPSGIGTLGEKTLHAVFKEYYCPAGAQKEVKIGAHVADIWDGNTAVEIQTRSFDRLRGKLGAMLPEHPVRIIYPLPHRKWLLWVDGQTGEVSRKRLSPKRGNAMMAFRELYKIKPFLCHPNLRLNVVLVDVEEFRLLNGWSADRKRGSSRHDRLPLSLAEEVEIDGLPGWLQMIPGALPCRFTAKDFCAAARISTAHAQTALNVLHSVGAVVRVGKNGNAIVYERCAD